MAGKGHKHWEPSHPFYPYAPTCTLTVKACDQLWTWYLHRHEGQPCVKERLPGNKTERCILALDEEALEARRSKRVNDLGEGMVEPAGVEPAS